MLLPSLTEQSRDTFWYSKGLGEGVVEMGVRVKVGVGVERRSVPLLFRTLL